MALRSGFAVLALLAATTAGAEDKPAEMPAFMAGAWGHADDARWSDEHWTAPRGGIMIGAARSGQSDSLDFWEHARIVRREGGGLSYFAMPMGNPATEFRLVAVDATSVEVANPEHDYPQRIRYWRDGDQLMAEVSLMDGSRAERWTMSRLGG